jgi:Dockerin type I domain
VYYGLCESSALIGGACGGTTNWLILHDAYSQYDDGYGVFLPSDASTDVVMSEDAVYMTRLRRGDLDFDGDVDQSDFGVLQVCLTGVTGGFPQPSCRNADMDNNGRADETDVAIFICCMDGSSVTPDPNCIYADCPR